MNTMKPITGLASIIIPCWNQLEFTQQCLAALMKNTRRPWELIVIDNGSTDATGAYLAGVRDMASVPVTLISNSTNLGFPAAINQGLQVARGEYLVLLNNDVVLTNDWLDQLVALATAKIGIEEDLTAKNSRDAKKERDDRGCSEPGGLREPGAPSLPPIAEGPPPTPKGIGLVGPMSNYAAPPQWIEHAPYFDLREMPAFAQKWRNHHRAHWFTVHKLSGFCLLMKRAVYDTIGGLDERFGFGFFDDDDLAERARRAGFQLAVAVDLFVHHFGSRTFAGNGIDAGKVLDSAGLTISPRPATGHCRTRPAITCSGSMPMMWSSRMSLRSCWRFFRA
jgi:GT2 family glycosyltransferase